MGLRQSPDRSKLGYGEDSGRVSSNMTVNYCLLRERL